MITSNRQLITRRGTIRFPTFIPVTTFGDKYPLDKLIQPYLPRLASAMMVSYHYARLLQTPPRIPLLIDSGGFAALFENARIIKAGNLGLLKLKYDDRTETLHPSEVLSVQEQLADVAFTLDFPIPPGLDLKEARKRQRLTIANATWALENRRRQDLKLYACLQAWDVPSARACARAYANLPFDGIAIGGLVPRSRDQATILAIIQAVREEIGDLPLHVFGLGHPHFLNQLYAAGVDSVDSSSYVKLAADGRLWSDQEYRIADPAPMDRLHLALCNLATATGKSLPLSASGIVFHTHNLASQHPNMARL